MTMYTQYHPVPYSSPIFLDLAHDVPKRHSTQVRGKFISQHAILHEFFLQFEA